MRNYKRSDARAKLGDVVYIDGFAPDENGSIPEQEKSLIGKTGTVTLIDDIGAIHGTWGGLSLLPIDSYHVIEEAKGSTAGHSSLVGG